mgnify:CR=1 FL=1
MSKTQSLGFIMRSFARFWQEDVVAEVTWNLLFVFSCLTSSLIQGHHAPLRRLPKRSGKVHEVGLLAIVRPQTLNLKPLPKNRNPTTPTPKLQNVNLRTPNAAPLTLCPKPYTLSRKPSTPYPKP